MIKMVFEMNVDYLNSVEPSIGIKVIIGRIGRRGHAWRQKLLIA